MPSSLVEGASFDDRVSFLAEATLMKDCEHENVLGLVGCFIKEGQPFVVLPLMENGDVKTFISNPNNVRFMMVDLFLHKKYSVSVDEVLDVS